MEVGRDPPLFFRGGGGGGGKIWGGPEDCGFLVKKREDGGDEEILATLERSKSFYDASLFFLFLRFFGTEGQVRICLFFARDVPNGVWFPGNFFCQTKN